MSKRSKRRWKKRQKHLKKIVRRQTQFNTLSQNKETILREKSKKEFSKPKKLSKVSEKTSKTTSELPYLKKDLLRVSILAAFFLLILIALYVWDLKTGILLVILSKIF